MGRRLAVTVVLLLTGLFLQAAVLCSTDCSLKQCHTPQPKSHGCPHKGAPNHNPHSPQKCSYEHFMADAYVRTHQTLTVFDASDLSPVVTSTTTTSSEHSPLVIAGRHLPLARTPVPSAVLKI